MRRTIQLTLVALLATSCAQSGGRLAEGEGSPSATASASTTSPPTTPPSADPYLPTYPSMEALPAAQVGGRLVLDDGCLWLETPEYRALPLWPADSRVERDGDTLVVINSGGSRAEVGTDVIGGGGEYTAVVELIGEEIPPACRGDDYYWLVYEVETADE